MANASSPEPSETSVFSAPDPGSVSSAQQLVDDVLGEWPGDISIMRRNGLWLIELFVPSYQIGPYSGQTFAEALDAARDWVRALNAYMGK